MKYTKFIIKNYKGIKDLTLDLEKEPKSKVFTLVGLNESGKTSILEAIDLLESDLSNSQVHTLIPKAQKLNFNDSVSIEASLQLNASDEEALKKYAKTLGYRELYDVKEFKIIQAFKFLRSEYLPDKSGKTFDIMLMGIKKGRSNYKVISTGSDDGELIIDFIIKNLLPSIIYYPNFLFDFPPRIYLEESEDESEEQEKYREMLGDILDTIGGGLNIQKHLVDRMRSNKEESKEALDSTIIKIGSKITKIVFDAWEALFDSRGKEIILKPGKEKKTVGTEFCYLEVRLKERSSQFQIAERSLGFKWFFTFLLFTEFRKHRISDKGEILFLLDEPASNLHSTAQKKLLETFEKLVTNCKLIYTTHSHHLINPNWLNGAYIVRNKALDYDDEFNFESENTDIEANLYKQFVAKNPEQKTFFQPILDALDYQPGLLEEIPDIIITEGKSDYYIFKYVNKIILNEKYDLKFYPGNGADRSDQVISLYLSWNRNFHILLDGDKPGQKAKVRYLKEFGEEVSAKIISLNEINSKYDCAIENLFSEHEKLRITKLFDGEATKYDKSKFNVSIQSLLLEKTQVELSQITIKKFETIFAYLKEKNTPV